MATTALRFVKAVSPKIGVLGRRSDRFLVAGVDNQFVESPASEKELLYIGKYLVGEWALANMVEGGKLPILLSNELAKMGFNLAIHPVMTLRGWR